MTDNRARAGMNRHDNIALIFQEVLTRIVRLRSSQLDRQRFPDVESFRYDVREAVGDAVARARAAGYSIAEYTAATHNDGRRGDVEMCTLAVVGFLDQSFLDLGGDLFVEWGRQPLTEVFFGHHLAGEYFFQNLDALMLRDDSANLADLLELHYLCLLLGFSGGHKGDYGYLHAKEQELDARIRRIRGALGNLSPAGVPDSGIAAAKRASGIRPYLIAAVGFLVATIVLFLCFKASLGGGVADARAIGAGGV